jgi:hypothetical protein
MGSVAMTIMEELGFSLAIAVAVVGSLTVGFVMYQWASA